MEAYTAVRPPSRRRQIRRRGRRTQPGQGKAMRDRGRVAADARMATRLLLFRDIWVRRGAIGWGRACLLFGIFRRRRPAAETRRDRLKIRSSCVRWCPVASHLGLGLSLPSLWVVFSYKILNFNFFFRHLHRNLNLDEIKNILRLLSVNGETNLMNLIRL